MWAIFCDELMACAALVQIGPAAAVVLGAVHARAGELRERTRLLPRRRRSRARRRAAGGRPRPRRADADRGVRSSCDWRSRRASRRSARRRAAGVDAQAGGRRRAGHPRDRRRPGRARCDALAVIDDTSGTTRAQPSGTGARASARARTARRLPGTSSAASTTRRGQRAGRVGRGLARRGRRRSASRRTCRASAATDGTRAALHSPRPSAARHESLLMLASDYRAPFGSLRRARCPGHRARARAGRRRAPPRALVATALRRPCAAAAVACLSCPIAPLALLAQRGEQQL